MFFYQDLKINLAYKNIINWSKNIKNRNMDSLYISFPIFLMAEICYFYILRHINDIPLSGYYSLFSLLLNW